MSAAKKFATGVYVNPAYLVALKALEYEAYRWGLAANGRRPQFNNPISMAFGREAHREAIDKYFDAIEKMIPPKVEGEVS